MQNHQVVSREAWLAARKEHLAKEKEFTRLRDQLSQARRELPWGKVEKRLCFQWPDWAGNPLRFVRGSKSADHLPLYVWPRLDRGMSELFFLGGQFQSDWGSSQPSRYQPGCCF